MNGSGTIQFPNGSKLTAEFEQGAIVGDVTLRYK